MNSLGLLGKAFVVVLNGFAFVAVMIWLFWPCGPYTMQTVVLGDTGWVIRDQIRSCSAIDQNETLKIVKPGVGKPTMIASFYPVKVEIIYDGKDSIHIKVDKIGPPYRALEQFAGLKIDYEDLHGPVKPDKELQ